MSTSVLLDAAGRRRSPATMPGHHRGRPPRNRGRQYPADPPTVEEIVAVMRYSGPTAHGLRVRALIVVLWRAGLRISEALALAESDLDPSTGAILVRRGKGGKRREVGMDRWGWQQIEPWLDLRPALPVGVLLCVMHGPTAGRPWSPTAARSTLRRLAVSAGVRRRFAPHQLRHAHAVEMAREGVPLTIVQRQLGHANLGITSIYLQGIDNSEIINTVLARPHQRCPPAPDSADRCRRRGGSRSPRPCRSCRQAATEAPNGCWASGHYDSRVAARAVLLDVDGTLLDNLANQRRVWGAWADRFALDADAVFACALRTTPRETFAQVAPDRDPGDCLAVLHEIEDHDARAGSYTAFAGARKLLRRLPPDAWAVVTSNYAHRVAIRFERLGLPRPPVVIDAEAVARGKPDPQGYIRAAAELGVAP
jgi:hypothetical protein